MQNEIFIPFHMEIYLRDTKVVSSCRSQNCKSLSLSQHMLLSALFAYMVGSVLQLVVLSHFLTFVWRKNNEQKLICFLFRIYMQKLICPHFFVAQSVAQQKIFQTNDHHFEL